MTIHDNSQLRDSHNQFSTNPTRDVRSDHRSVRPRTRTLSLNRPRPRCSVPCLNQTNNITIHSRTGDLDEKKRMDSSAKRSDHKSIRFIRRPGPSLAVYTSNLGRSFPWRHVPLLLLLLISLSGIHLHGLAFPRSEHAGKTTPPHTVLFSNRRSLSLFIFWCDFGRALPKEFRAIFCASDSLFIEKSTPNCPEETSTSS